MPNESIGGISVSIAVGLQDLQAQLSQAQQMSDAAGKAMAAAFNSSAGSLNQVATAASEATGKVDSLGSSFQNLVAIGEALAITEGLREFGKEALTAFGDIEKVSISIEHMTGSMEQTEQILSGIKEIGLSSPFSFPELQDTAQRMIAMGVPVEKVHQSLVAVADAAAATGKSLLVASGAFDRITETGSAAARQLAQIGVTTERLAAVMGVAKNEVLAAFKALPDQAARIDVLNQAMERFTGSAEAQAKGIAGQWNIFGNQFTIVMQEVGKALAPVVEDLMHFATTAIKVIQSITDDFNKLPGPVKDVAVAIGIAAAAIVPLFAAVGLLGQGIIGVAAVVEPFNALLLALGIRSTEAAVAQGAETLATVAQGAASTTAAVEVGALAAAETVAGEASSIAAIQMGLFGEAVGGSTVFMGAAATQMTLFTEETGAIAIGAGSAGLGITAMGAAATAAAVAIGALIGYGLGKWIQESLPQVENLERALFGLADKVPFIGIALDSLRGKVQALGGDSKDQAEEIRNLQTQLFTLGATVERGTMTAEQYIAALREVRAEYADLNGPGGPAAYGAALDALLQKHKDLGLELTKANGMLEEAQQRYKAGTISAAQLGEAQKNLADTQKKLNALNPQYAESLAGLTEAYNKNRSAIDTLSGSISQLLSIENRTAAQESILDTAMAKRWDLIQKNIKAVAEQMGAEDAVLKSAQAMVKSASEFETKEQAVTLAVKLSKAALDELTSSNDRSAEHQRAVNDALTQYATALRNAGGPLDGLITLTKDGVQYTTTMAQALQHAKDGLTAFSDEAVRVPQSVDKAWESINNLPVALRETVDGVTGTINVLRALAPVGREARLQFDQIGYGAGNSAGLIRGLTDEMNRTISVAGKAVITTDSLADAVNHVGQATSDALAIEKAWNGALGVTVDNTSKMANSVGKVAGELHNMATKADAAATAAFDADKSFKATTGSVNALSVGVAFLAMQLSGLTMFAGSGIDYSKGQSDLQHQLYLAKQMAGDPSAQPTESVVATSGPLKGKSFGSIDELNQALEDLKNNVDAATKATTTTATATKTNTAALTGKASANDTAASATLGLADATTSLARAMDQSSVTTTDALGNVTTVYSNATEAQQQFVDGLGNVYNSYQSLVDAINSNPLLAGPAKSQGQDLVGGRPSSTSGTVTGPDGKTYNSAYDLYQAIQANPNLLAHTAQGANMTSGPSTATPAGQSAWDMYLAIQKNPNLLPHTATFDLPSAMEMNTAKNVNPSWNTGTVKSNQQNGVNGQGIVVNVNYPQFNSQQQADQVMKNVVAQLRTVVGLKI